MSISPTRIALARRLRALTLVELGRLADLSGQTISRYENGRQEPTDESLLNLSAALDLPVRFFEGPEIDPLPLDAVSFRALSKTPAARRDAALAAGEIAIQIADWIGERYRLPAADVSSYRIHEPRRVDDAEVIAMKVRAAWDLGSKPIPNMIHLLEARGVRVFSLAQQIRDIDAFSFYHAAVPFVFLDTGKTAERQRFDAAHELGHLVMHQGAEVNRGRDAEREADRFAAAFLMPRDDVLSRGLMNASMAKILDGRKRWRVSAMALTHRLWETGHLSEWGYRSTCVELSGLGYRRSEPGSALHPEKSQVLHKVVAHLRSTKLGILAIARDLNITAAEFNRHVFGLIATVHAGEGVGRVRGRARGDHLRLVVKQELASGGAIDRRLLGDGSA